MNAAPVDVLVVGDLNPDLLVTGDDLSPRWDQGESDAEMHLVLGGSGGICSAGLARLGLATALCATVGNDDLGAISRRMVADRGVVGDAIRVVDGARTGLSMHLIAAPDRAMFTDRGAILELTVDEAIAAVERMAPRHVHLAAVYLLPALVGDGGRLVDVAHRTGATVSVDTNFDPAGEFARPEWLTGVDVLMPNETEALRLCGRASGGSDDVEAAARELAAGGALVTVKQGGRGAFAVHGSERAVVELPASSVGGDPTSATTGFADAVGAGDSFNGGLIRAVLDGRPLPAALAFACATGTLSTRAAGGTAAQATFDEADALAATWLA